MSYILERYTKDGDRPEWEKDVSSAGGDALARVFGQPVEEFVDAYPVDERQAAQLRELTGTEFDLDRYEYFLTALSD